MFTIQSTILCERMILDDAEPSGRFCYPSPPSWASDATRKRVDDGTDRRHDLDDGLGDERTRIRSERLGGDGTAHCAPRCGEQDTTARRPSAFIPMHDSQPSMLDDEHWSVFTSNADDYELGAPIGKESANA